MTDPEQHLKPLVVATIAVAFALAACQERKPTDAPIPSASSGEYPTPSEQAPSSTTGAGSGAPASGDGKADGRK